MSVADEILSAIKKCEINELMALMNPPEKMKNTAYVLTVLVDEEVTNKNF